LAAVIVAKEAGAGKVIVTGVSKDRSRLELAKTFGADMIIDIEKMNPVEVVREITQGRMADVVMDVTGNPRGVQTTIDLVKKKGTVILPGLYGMDVEIPLTLDKIIFKEVRLQGVASHDFRSVLPAIQLAESFTHRFQLKEAEKAVRVAGREVEGEDPIKVVIIRGDHSVMILQNIRSISWRCPILQNSLPVDQIGPAVGRFRQADILGVF
jgi:alcohol dehydrogenase